jgi:isoleucyl-tRNA synthetase
MPEKHTKDLESILLSDWPLVSVKWTNSALESEFEKILKLREIVTKAIEPLRAQKEIGSSLEVAVYIEGGDKSLLEKYATELSNIFITSQAFIIDSKPENVLNELKEDDYTIYVTRAKGKKCDRCWKYRDLLDVGNGNGICKACLAAINGKD